MNTEKIVQTLNEHDFRIDSKGRVVIENSDLMDEINGATGVFPILGSNGACINSGCK